MTLGAFHIHHTSLGKQRVDAANALISLQFFGRPVTLPWPDGFASGGGKEVPKSGTPVVVRVRMRSGELNTLRSAQVRRISWVRRVGRLFAAGVASSKRRGQPATFAFSDEVK